MNRKKADPLAFQGDKIHCQDIVLDRPVFQGMGPGGIRPDHSSDLAGQARRRIGCKKPSTLHQTVVQFSQNHARTDLDISVFDAGKIHPLQAGHSQDDSRPDGPASQVCPSRTTCQGNTVCGDETQDRFGAFDTPGQNDSLGIDPVDSGVIGKGLAILGSGQDRILTCNSGQFLQQGGRDRGTAGVHRSKTFRPPSPNGVCSQAEGSDPFFQM